MCEQEPGDSDAESGNGIGIMPFGSRALPGHKGMPLILLCYKCDKLLRWPNDLRRQAHKRNALRPIWMVWRKLQGMLTE